MDSEEVSEGFDTHRYTPRIHLVALFGCFVYALLKDHDERKILHSGYVPTLSKRARSKSSPFLLHHSCQHHD